MATSTGRAGVATSCSVCASDQAEYSSPVDGRPLCWQCWRGEQIAEQLVGETEQEMEGARVDDAMATLTAYGLRWLERERQRRP